jgi:hypothetical protein
MVAITAAPGQIGGDHQALAVDPVHPGPDDQPEEQVGDELGRGGDAQVDGRAGQLEHQQRQGEEGEGAAQVGDGRPSQKRPKSPETSQLRRPLACAVIAAFWPAGPTPARVMAGTRPASDDGSCRRYAIIEPLGLYGFLGTSEGAATAEDEVPVRRCLGVE